MFYRINSAEFAAAAADARRRALDTARIAASNNDGRTAGNAAAWSRSISRAAAAVAAGAVVIVSTDGRAAVGSRTRPGVVYEATATRCQCEAFAAGKPCHHRAAAKIASRIATAPAETDAERAARYAETNRRALEIFG